MESPRGVTPRSSGAIAAIVAIVLDQASKYFVTHGFADGTLSAGPLMPFLDLALRYNRGVSFSLLTQNGALGAALLTAFSFAVSVILAVWLWRAKTPLTGIGLGLIIGGAVGNAVDRAGDGAVVDFLDLHALGRQFFVFNVADAAISAGVALLVIETVFTPQRATAK